MPRKKDENRKEFEEKYGDVWDTKELVRDYEVQSFLAPFVFVIRRKDGVKGTMLFNHMPRYYFCFTQD